MALFNLDVNKMSPKTGESITPSTNSFTFQTNGNETFNYALRKMYQKPTALASTNTIYSYKDVWENFNVWYNGELTSPLPDKQTVTITTPFGGDNYVGYSCGYQICCYGYTFTATAVNTNRLKTLFTIEDANALGWILDSFHSGDMMVVYKSDSSLQQGTYLYVHKYREHDSSYGANMYYEFFTDRGDSLTSTYDADTGLPTSAFKGFVAGETWYMRRVTLTPIITFNLTVSIPFIQLQTTYSDQTLTYDKDSGGYICSNSSINLAFSLTGVNTDIYRYRILLYSDSFGDKDFKPISTGEWIYNKDMRYQVSNQLDGSNLYIAVQATDTMNTEYTTYKAQAAQGIYDYAIHIQFSYTGKYPSLLESPKVSYDVCNGYDLISWKQAMLLYGGVYPMNSSHEYTDGYGKFSDFITTGNNAMSLKSGYTFTIPRDDEYHNPCIFQIKNPSSCPIFLWQPSSEGFSGLVVSYTDGNTTIGVYIENGRIIRRCTSTIPAYNGIEIDDGAITITTGVVYLVGVTNERAIFRVYCILSATHNQLDFELSDGNTAL